MIDCIIIGGGPAGLTAAIYLARFHLSVLVIDSGRSRMATIPLTRNHAGFPDGVEGKVLLDRMRDQAISYGARLISGDVTRLARCGDDLIAHAGDQTFSARAILLASGVTNVRPTMSDAFHDQALACGRVRYCPICDGYEVTDKRIGVLGTGERGVKEAIFLRSYSADITLIAPDGPHDLSPDLRAAATNAGITLLDGPARGFALGCDGINMRAGIVERTFDTIYPAMGSVINSARAADLGAERSAEGSLIVDAHQRTTALGLYAAGDVVLGLDQISHAMGEGGVAATTIRNDLAESAPLRR
jgi:thioredoxin reductase (NADPH)